MEEAQQAKFCSGMKNAFDHMCNKYKTKINSLTQNSSLIESSLFDLKLLAAPMRKIKHIE